MLCNTICMYIIYIYVLYLCLLHFNNYRINYVDMLYICGVSLNTYYSLFHFLVLWYHVGSMCPPKVPAKVQFGIHAMNHQSICHYKRHCLCVCVARQ